ncbi:MAG: S8 family serine peptidase [Arcobacter sp.]|nr:S8 family serine peptidase [Arcobacter sp.]
MNKSFLTFPIFILLFILGCGGGSGGETLNSSNDSEPFYSEQWALAKNDGFYFQHNINENANINSSNVFSKYKGKNVKIAVIDDGLDVNHEDLSGAIINTYDNDTQTTDVSQNNDETHGTAVTGIIAARENSLGIKGIASSSDIIFLKKKYPGTDAGTIELFNKAEEFGADIINCSWGTYNVSDIVKDKIIDLSTNGRNGKGTIIVFASGNDNQDIGNDEANINEVISVGATNKNNLRTDYSNFGQNLDILAPGGEYLGITTLDPMGSLGKSFLHLDYTLYNDYDARFTGTSASAPIVSGVIALMLEKNPNLTRVEVESLLRSTADKIGEDPYINGRNDYYGYGKINLANLILAVPDI